MDHLQLARHTQIHRHSLPHRLNEAVGLLEVAAGADMSTAVEEEEGNWTIEICSDHGTDLRRLDGVESHRVTGVTWIGEMTGASSVERKTEDLTGSSENGSLTDSVESHLQFAWTRNM